MDCIFCKIIKGDIPSYKLYEDEKVYVFLDINPVSVGHTLVIPKEHFKDIDDIEEDVLIHIFKVAKDIKNLLIEKLNCDGITFIQNNGDVQEVKHYHLHIKPYYNNEVSMSVEEVYDVLTK